MISFKYLSITGLTLLLLQSGLFAAEGDYRTISSGNWNNPGIWQHYTGGAWVAATTFPTYSDNNIDVRSGYTVTITADITLDQTDISGGLTLNGYVTLTIYNGTGSDFYITGGAVFNGTVNVNTDATLTTTSGGNTYFYGTVNNQGDVGGAGNIYFSDGSLYNHAVNGTGIPSAAWYSASTCKISGSTSNPPSNLNQNLGNFTWDNAQTATYNLPQIGEIHGNFNLVSTGASYGIQLSVSTPYTLVIDGNYNQTGGRFWPSGGSANNIIYVRGNFFISSGFISSSGSGDCTFKLDSYYGFQTYTKTGDATYYQKVNFEVLNYSTLDMADNTIDNSSSGYFTLASGCGFKTTHSQGIASSGNSGCIQLTGSRSYASDANYFYYRNGSQSTGNGLPSTLSGVLTIGSTSGATILTITNGSETISNKLVLVSSGSANSSIASGTISYGSAGTLEYQGGSAQTTAAGEWPVSSGPVNVTINNSNGVNLHADRTINGGLSLTNGAFSIGAHTLILNGSLTRTSGTLTGGSSSNIVVGGSSPTALDLPSVILNDLTLNRGSGIRLLGNITINGTLTMTYGAINLNGYSIIYGPSGTLKYNGASVQTTANAEFPSSGGPFNLYSDNSAGLNLHASRALAGTLTLNRGQFSIGATTLTLNGPFTVNSGTMLGGTSSNLVFGGSGSCSPLPAVTLNDLRLNRGTGLTLGGNVTAGGTLYLDSGPLSIGSNTLTLTGLLNRTSGSLTGGASSNIYIGGISALPLDLPSVSLNNLTLNRGSGLRLQGNLTIYGILTITNGSINLNGYIIIYGGAATLKYNGTSEQTTANAELPAVNGPFNLYADNAIRLNLHTGRTLEGTLTLNNGLFSIGANTLTLNGAITINSGILSGGSSSNLIFGGSGLSTNLPSVLLNDLRINRASGIGLSGDVTIEGTLYLDSGPFSINSTTLHINGPLAQTAGSLAGGSSSNIIFGGTGPWTYLPAIILNDLEINRPDGIKMAGKVTAGHLLLLSNGMFSIESNTLVINGDLTRFSGSLNGGPFSNITFGGAGSSTYLPAIQLNNLTINRPAGIGISGDVTVEGLLSLNSGNLSINDNTLNINGKISYTSLLTGGSWSNIVFGGSGELTNLREITLHDLTINRASGIGLAGDVSIRGTLYLTTGNLNINSTTLRINGDISYVSSLVGGSISNLIFGGGGVAGTLKSIILNNLNLERPEGLDLTDNIIVYGIFSLADGQLRRYGHTMYGPSASLRYCSLSAQTTSDEEFPALSGPFHILSENFRGVNLHNDRTIEGNLMINAGFFSIGPHTLTLNGMIMGGGSLAGGLTSNLTFAGIGGGSSLPAVTLKKLTINRAAGIWMNGDVTVNDSLDLISGNFMVMTHMLTLNGPPISGTPSNLQTDGNSGLTFGGSYPGIAVPIHIANLNRLTIANPKGVELMNNLFVNGMLSIESFGFLNCHDRMVMGTASFFMNSNSKLGVGHSSGVTGNIAVSGPKMIDSKTDWEFNGNVDQVTLFLPTMVPNTIRNLVINNSNNSTVTLVDNMTLTGNLEIRANSAFSVDMPITLSVEGDVILDGE